MQQFSFHDVSKQCNDMLKNVSDPVIQKLYSKFNFFHTNCYFKSHKKNIVKDYLLHYLKEYKFMTYQYHSESIFKDFKISQANQEITNNPLAKNVNVVLCVENNCLLIEQINENLIDEIFVETKSSLINVNINKKDEISTFCQNFNLIISTNKLIKYTIKVIAGYIIGRFYYPSNFFKFPSFFDFDQNNNSRVIDENIKTIFNEGINAYSEKKVTQLMENYSKSITTENKQKIYNFEENEFIQLKNFYSKEDSMLYLVIHVDSFYLFWIKKFNIPKNEYEKNREIEFVKNYSHRCINRFYGFVRDIHYKISGLVYEFNSNGSLSDFFKKTNKISALFPFITMIRIFSGIKYLHSNNLIHRDLKPGNILINHDFVPFISDFETIRNLEKESLNPIFTNDIGSNYYVSPEQYCGNIVSYPTDIYSFGCIIYFLFEKKDPLAVDLKIKNKSMPQITCAPKNIQKIYLTCTKNDPNDRFSLNDLDSIIIEEIYSIFYIEQYFNQEYDSMTNDLMHYFNENIQLLLTYQNESHIKNKLDFYLQLDPIFTGNKSNRFLLLAEFYLNGKVVEQNYTKAREYYELSAKLNNSVALFNLGILYFNGYGVKQDYTKAREYYELSAKLNNSVALFNLGFLYCNGYGVKQDYNKGIEYYELSAKLNNSDSMLNLGIIYMNGQGVEQNYSRAIEYFESSAKLDNSDALYNLGNLYYVGIAVKQNYIKAKEYFELSAKLENSNALFSLGVMYFKGQGVGQNYTKAKEYFEISGKFGNSKALFNLGIFYFHGYGVKQNYTKAKEYYELSAKLNDPNAILYLGDFYYKGYGIKQSFTKAREYFELSAKLGNSYALFILGIMYYNGNGVQQNYTKAVEYFKSSANQYNSEALFSLGKCYYHGYGVNQNYSRAVEYFKLSANQYNSDAFCYLGECYYRGYGVNQNYTKAVDYFKLSANQYNSNALLELGNIYLDGYAVKQNFIIAIEYLELSAKLNNNLAIGELGYLYFYGIGVEKNYTKARIYFEILANQNNHIALCFLGDIFYYGCEAEINYEKARVYYELSAIQNNSNALFSLGIMYCNGHGVKQDYTINFADNS